jgi:hypothetical protein
VVADGSGQGRASLPSEVRYLEKFQVSTVDFIATLTEVINGAQNLVFLQVGFGLQKGVMDGAGQSRGVPPVSTNTRIDLFLPFNYSNDLQLNFLLLPASTAPPSKECFRPDFLLPVTTHKLFKCRIIGYK